MSLLSAVKFELTALFDLLLPPVCPLCQREMPAKKTFVLCPCCMEQLPPLPAPRCPLCALPFATEGGNDHLCESCLRNPPLFGSVAAVGSYAELLRDAVHRFKFQGTIQLDRPLGTLLAQRMEAAGQARRPDLIIPVPLHFSRLQERGYNQSLLLARVLGKRWQIPVAARLLVRNRPTPSQQGLTAAIRQQNLKGAFSLCTPLQGQTILLVDDVMTTGATARECARELRSAGAAEVAVAVIGRALRHH